MTEFLNELSENQINYLKQQKKHKYIVGISRILILFSFLFLWEFTANVGIIDSFIFSSPSKIAHLVSNFTGFLPYSRILPGSTVPPSV